MINQCRAASDSIEGAAIKSTPPAIQATVGICHTRRNSVRSYPLLLLLRRTFCSRLTLEKAVRSWASFDVEARNAVQAVDRRRMDYIEGRVKMSGLAEDIAQARAQILDWTFVGYAVSDN
jgi:hypothetical protein